MPTYKKYCCRQIEHFTQRRKPYTVHVIQETKDTVEVYIQKDGFPMIYAFGFEVDTWSVMEAFQAGWRDLYKNNEIWERVFI